jgi:hypothetical protein
MRNLLAILSIAFLALAACSESEITTRVDLFSFLGTEDVSFSSPTFNAPADTPIDEPLSSPLIFSADLVSPVTVNLLEGGADLIEILSTALNFEASLDPQGFTGSGMVALVLSDDPSFSSQNSERTVTISSIEQSLPATFDLSTSDTELNELFTSDEIYLKYEVTIGVTSISGLEISVNGAVSEFDVVISGKQGLF